MAKGKHPPAKGAIRPDKILHPYSRKVKKLQHKEYQKIKTSGTLKRGCARLTALGEKLLWFHDNLSILACTQDETLNEHYSVGPEDMITLIEAYLERFNDEIQAIQIKSSIGKHRKHQHSSRSDAIKMTLEQEKGEFLGCGLEVPDLMDKENLNVFRNWTGELRFVSNIKIKKYTKKFLCDYKPDAMDMN
eukprot:TRINITY_DN3142_c0_g1_i1.p1 TRINITY_DN3142_c0_g1~~TRINITY_DN3142_c0_g1_i1.p1  ORF type:complete len:190 (-),score=34.95 TRINITY_DN3142_c0_g1_i1:109-678(-)